MKIRARFVISNETTIQKTHIVFSTIKIRIYLLCQTPGFFHLKNKGYKNVIIAYLVWLHKIVTIVLFLDQPRQNFYLLCF